MLFSEIYISPNKEYNLHALYNKRTTLICTVSRKCLEFIRLVIPYPTLTRSNNYINIVTL